MSFTITASTENFRRYLTLEDRNEKIEEIPVWEVESTFEDKLRASLLPISRCLECGFFLNFIWNGLNIPREIALPLLGMSIITYVPSAYYLFNNRKEIIKISRITYAHFKRNNIGYNKIVTSAMKNKISNELKSEIGNVWLKMKCLTLEEGVKHILEDHFEKGTCDGETLNFLEAICNSDLAMQDDNTFESKLDPIQWVKYQTMRLLEIDVKNHCKKNISNSYDEDTILQYDPHIENLENENSKKLISDEESIFLRCEQYNPYSIYNDHRIYIETYPKRAVSIIFEEIWKIVKTNLTNKSNLLVGRICFIDDSQDGHAFGVQFNLDHYRYRNLIIHSFNNVEDLFKDLYLVSNKYLQRYDEIQIVLWKFP